MEGNNTASLNIYRFSISSLNIMNFSTIILLIWVSLYSTVLFHYVTKNLESLTFIRSSWRNLTFKLFESLAFFPFWSFNDGREILILEAKFAIDCLICGFSWLSFERADSVSLDFLQNYPWFYLLLWTSYVTGQKDLLIDYSLIIFFISRTDVVEWYFSRAT